MKIGRSTPSGFQGKERLLAWLVLLLAGFGLGTLYGARWLTLFTDPVGVVQAALPAPELPTLTINIAFAEYSRILEQRAGAQADGVFIGDEEDFQQATVVWQDADGSQELPVRMRLRQGMTGPLGDTDKWPFEMRPRNNTTLLGMSRFTLQDPAANNWLNQWAFTQTLQREGLLAPRYWFVNLILNGENKGIYALQEGFSVEMLTGQGATPGVIVELATDRAWGMVQTYGATETTLAADPFANLLPTDFSLLDVDTVQDEALLRDPELRVQREQALSLFREWQTGEIAAADLFDVEQYGLFLALADWWAAPDAVSWLNLRYSYNPTTRRFAPLAANGNPLANENRIAAAALYDDLALQQSYLTAVQRIAQPDYLAALQAELEPEMERLQRALRAEVTVELPWATLAERQQLLQSNLNPVYPVVAYLGPATPDSITVYVASAYNLPLELVGFDIGGATFLEANPAWAQGDAAALWFEDAAAKIVLRPPTDNRLQFIQFQLPILDIQRQDNELEGLAGIDIEVVTRVYGLDNAQFTPVR